MRNAFGPWMAAVAFGVAATAVGQSPDSTFVRQGGSAGAPQATGLRPSSGLTATGSLGLSPLSPLSPLSVQGGVPSGGNPGGPPNCPTPPHPRPCPPIVTLPIWWTGYPFYPPFGTPYPYPYGYGFGYSDPYAATLQSENAALRQQVQRLEREAQQRPEREAVRIDVPLRARKKAEDDRRKNLEARAQQAVRSGNRAFASGSYLRAADRYREAARLAPHDASPHFLLAQALFAAKRYGEAAQAVKDGLRVNPDWVEIDFDARSLYGDAEHFSPQLALLARELQANPMNRHALFLLGYELFVTGERQKAKTIFEQVARLEPDDQHLKPFFDYFAKQAAAD